MFCGIPALPALGYASRAAYWGSVGAETERGGSWNVTCRHVPELMRGRSRRDGRLKLGTPKALDILGRGLGW